MYNHSSPSLNTSYKAWLLFALRPMGDLNDEGGREDMVQAVLLKSAHQDCRQPRVPWCRQHNVVHLFPTWVLWRVFEGNNLSRKECVCVCVCVCVRVCVGVYLFYTAGSVSAVQQSESAIGIHTSPKEGWLLLTFKKTQVEIILWVSLLIR